MNMKKNSSSVNISYENAETTYLSEKLRELPEDRKNVFIDCGNVVVNCCIGNTKVSMDDFVKDLCNLELRI